MQGDRRRICSGSAGRTMNMSRPIADWIDRARAVPIEAELERRGVRLKGRGRERCGPCLRCGGTDRFSINTAKQVWNCRGFGGGDVIDLVVHLDDCDFNTAVAVLAGEASPDYSDWQQQFSASLRRKEIEYGRRRTLDAAQIWDAATTLPQEAIDYFAGRGIVLDDVPEGALRWHPQCRWDLGTKPCIVARYTDAITGEPRGIWRRPITGEKPKTLGPMGGCVIRLWPEIGQQLVIGEGVETVLAAATRITHRGAPLRPTWAAGSAGNIQGFPVLRGVSVLKILVDNDVSGTGQRVAIECTNRWTAAGKTVFRLIPKKVGADFNDLVLR